MRHVVCWVVAPALLILLLAPQPADARIIYTAPIEDVLPHASHVIRAHWSKKHPLEFEVEQVFRGEGLKVGQTIVVHGLYNLSVFLLESSGFAF